MLRSEKFSAVASALAAAQAELKNPTKGKTAKIKSSNANFEYRYADFAAALEMIRPILSKNKLALVQTPRMEAREMTLETQLIHESGEWIGCDYPVCPLNIDHRAMGSALSYARRYALFPMLGIQGEEEDDDDAKPDAPPPPPPPSSATESIGKFYLSKLTACGVKSEFDELLAKARDASGRMTDVERSAIAKLVPIKAKEFSTHAAPQPKDDGSAAYEKLLTELRTCSSPDMCKQWKDLRQLEIDALPENWQDAIMVDFDGQASGISS